MYDQLDPDQINPPIFASTEAAVEAMISEFLNGLEATSTDCPSFQTKELLNFVRSSIDWVGEARIRQIIWRNLSAMVDSGDLIKERKRGCYRVNNLSRGARTEGARLLQALGIPIHEGLETAEGVWISKAALSSAINSDSK